MPDKTTKNFQKNEYPDQDNRNSQARLAGIINSAMDAIISVDAEQRIILFNTAAEKVFGYRSDEILGKPLGTLLPQRYREMHQGHIQRFSSTGETNRSMGNLGKLYGLRANGEEFPIEASISQLGEGSEKILTVILRDISERVRTEEQLRRKEQSLQAAVDENNRLLAQSLSRLEFAASLRTIDLAITSASDIRIVLNVLLDQIVSQLDVDAAVILLSDPATQQLRYVDGRGFLTNLLKSSQVTVNFHCAEEAAAERKTVWEEKLDTAESDPDTKAFLSTEGFETCYATPLISKGEIEGILVIFQRSHFMPEQEWIDRFEALSGQAAIAIDSAQLFDRLQKSNQQLLQAYDATIVGWSRALDLRDRETEGHTLRVTDMTLTLAEHIGIFSEEDLRFIRWGALLHDIGKMGVPDGILHKPGELTEDEMAVMRRHPDYAFHLLYPVSFLRKALDIPRYHHERWDGAGYPYGLHGDHIPIQARLFSVVDVWDALRSNRAYRAGWTDEQVVAYLKENSGAQFDPTVVHAFVEVLMQDQDSSAPSD
jgi:PAS domain S-box-containing protein/putative nucleotidyltransferase with HDIG domain